MKTIAWAGVALIMTVALGGCAPMTPEQLAALEAQQKQQAAECQQRGLLYVSGTCISRGGGA